MMHSLSGRTIYISGSMAYDRIMDFPGKFSDYILPDKIHILNVCFNVNGLTEKFGGTAGNVAYTLSLLKEMPVVMATIGKDFDSYFDWLKKHNISLEGIRTIDDEFTAGAYITTDKSDNQITGFNPGAMKYQAEYRLDDANPGTAVVLIAPGNIQDMMSYAAVCRSKGIPYICDPGQSLSLWDGNALREWIEGSLIFVSNDYELELVMTMTGIDKKGMLRMTNTIITTLGEKGALISTHNSNERIPSAAVSQVLDPTGAGDAFRAGLLKGLVTGQNIETATRMGAVAATFAIENYGTQEHTFTYEAFLERYRINFGEL
jgi:adenosine kinase